jgi:hypothetical protein
MVAFSGCKLRSQVLSGGVGCIAVLGELQGGQRSHQHRGD